MISIIISSYQNVFFANISKNISETIGCEFEIIKVDNPGIMGICEAYNLGASQAKFENLLFLHEDVIFVTQNWGNRLDNLLSDQNIGIVGVAGSDYIPHCPSGWYNAGKNNYLNIEQFDDEANFLYASRTDSNKVACLLDGVFLGMKKSWWATLKFNKKIPGFHGYDTDISARSAYLKNNLVTNEIVITHFSKGKAGKNWFKTILEIRKYYERPKNQEVNRDLEIKNYNQFLYSLDHTLRKDEMLFYALKYLNPNYLGVKKTFQVLKSIIYNILNKP